MPTAQPCGEQGPLSRLQTVHHGFRHISMPEWLVNKNGLRLNEKYSLQISRWPKLNHRWSKTLFGSMIIRISSPVITRIRIQGPAIIRLLGFENWSRTSNTMITNQVLYPIELFRIRMWLNPVTGEISSGFSRCRQYSLCGYFNVRGDWIPLKLNAGRSIQNHD